MQKFLSRQVVVIHLCLILIPWAFAQAQQTPLIEVEQVRFQVLRDQWLRCEVRLRSLGNPREANPRFVSNITVDPILSFQRRDGEFLFFRARAQVVAIEQNQRAVVAFYLPGIIVRRDDLREPFAYLLDVVAAGEPQPYGRDWVSANIRENPQAILSLRNRALESANTTDGILRPAYLAPSEIVQPVNVRELPIYQRLESDFQRRP